MSILTVQNLSKTFGGLTAVSGFHMELQRGELVGLIGPNGAGKTTVFNLLTGVYRPTEGEILLHFEGSSRPLQGKRPCHICAEGVARTFQNIRLFRDLTALDNLRIAMHQNVSYGTLTGLLHTGAFRRQEAALERGALELLDRMGLYDKRDELARNLSYGEQRHLEIARALATNPTLLLLDEPAAGMNPAETAHLTELLGVLRREYDLTILLIEHDMSLVMRICERIYVLDYGSVIAEGCPQEIQSNRRVVEAYLGEDAAYV